MEISIRTDWPRMIQLAWIVTDEYGNLQKRRSHIIYPQGFTIDPTVANLTGITTMRAHYRFIDIFYNCVLLRMINKEKQDIYREF